MNSDARKPMSRYTSDNGEEKAPSARLEITPEALGNLQEIQTQILDSQPQHTSWTSW
jgi:hypothetical protein